MVDRTTTIPTEILEDAQTRLNEEYTLEELDSAAVLFSSGPLIVGAKLGLAKGDDFSVYLVAGTLAQVDLFTDYINRGFIDPRKINKFVNELKEEEKLAKENVRTG